MFDRLADEDHPPRSVTELLLQLAERENVALTGLRSRGRFLSLRFVERGERRCTVGRGPRPA